jgi:hypothetical protein
MTQFATALPEEPIIPTGYTIRVTVTRCNTCNSVNYNSEFLAMSLTKPRMGQGAPVKRWMECKRPEYDLPIDKVFINRMTPYCSQCPTIDLSLLPPPPHASGLHDLAEVALKGRPTSKPAASAAARPRIEDLA